jgi:hypothetical protein
VPQVLLCRDKLPGRGVPLDAAQPGSHIATEFTIHWLASFQIIISFN